MTTEPPILPPERDPRGMIPDYPPGEEPFDISVKRSLSWLINRYYENQGRPGWGAVIAVAVALIGGVLLGRYLRG